jgi:uncharacterized protein with von Willebrand factor type A (vWA) domain
MVGKTASRLAELAQRAGRWLGLAQTPPVRQTAAVVADRFDTMAWRDTAEQATALGELGSELGERYDYTGDLLADVFLAAYKTTPQVRDRADMDPSRLVNHQVISSLAGSPEFGDLRRETAGDPYAAAMAVLAQADGLRRMLAAAKTAAEKAQAATQARQQTEQAAQQVADALQSAADQADPDGGVPDEAAGTVEQALAAAAAAEQHADTATQDAAAALAAATPAIRAAARRAASQAAENAQAEAALMRAWGVEPGQLQRMSFDQRAQLARRLAGGRLGRFAELIGRFRQMAAGERARKVENAPGELVGITLGDDLTRLVPSEAASLAVAPLRTVFAARYAESRLMQYDSRGETHTGQGAIIACLDCSFSMADPRADGTTGEAWTKALGLALLDQARHARRDFVGILFSSATQVQVFRFPAREPANIGDVLDFAETFFAGGTDFQAPLSTAVELLSSEYNTEGRQRGDIVLVTDGECDVTEEWMRAWNEAKHQLGFRVFGVAIGAPHVTRPGGVLDALCDNLRSIDDLTDTHTAADLFHTI